MAIMDKVSQYLVEHPQPLIGAETVQLILFREILDYTVLRTEETRELNTVATPLSVNGDGDVRRVAFLASKQKAAESRTMEQLLRTATREAGIKVNECYLKDGLCLNCPRCALYGATSTESGRAERANIKHRIEYSTAFSLLPIEDIGDVLTFNAIDDKTITTGQALGQRYAVKPASFFPSVITLKSVTELELTLTVKTLLACKSYGAESRIGGDVRNSIVGVALGWEEVLTALELTLELYSDQSKNSPDGVKSLLEGYIPLTGNPGKVQILNPDEVKEFVDTCSRTELDKQFLELAYQDVESYRKSQIAK